MSERIAEENLNENNFFSSQKYIFKLKQTSFNSMELFVKTETSKHSDTKTIYALFSVKSSIDLLY